MWLVCEICNSMLNDEACDAESFNISFGHNVEYIKKPRIFRTCYPDNFVWFLSQTSNTIYQHYIV